MRLLSKVSAGALAQVCEGPAFLSTLNLVTASAAITECSIYDASMYPSPANPLTNLVTNGDFSRTVSTEWGVATGWTQDGTKITHSSGTTALTQDLSEASGDLYSVEFTVSGVAHGSVAASIGGVTLSTRSTNATFKECCRATGTGDFSITPSNDFDGSISDVKVYKLGDATDIVGSYKFSTTADSKQEDLKGLFLEYGCMCFVAGTGGEAWIYG